MLLNFISASSSAQPVLNIRVDTKTVNPLPTGASGFNVRIGDKVWSYDHPEFEKAVDTLKPGWLRFWSGTAGDAFSSGTGMYDVEYINMFDKGEAYDKLYEFVEVKGPHRIYDLYQLLGRNNARLVVTVNAFTESPEMTAELARFCKNNNIEVEAWQFCNEPYFYIPGRQRYWWNDGYDYAQKMKPHADSILNVFPGAKLALNFTWDGIWAFMKEINRYQQERGAFWNTFSKHSYAPHTGKQETFDEAYRRMNSKLVESTSAAAMSDIEKWTSKDIPMLITEFGVWNRPLNGIMSAVYNVEYTLRQMAHSNAWLIGSHEVSNKAKPASNKNDLITNAFAKGEKIDTKKILTGILLDDEGTALRILHEATSNANGTFATTIDEGLQVNGMQDKAVSGQMAMAFKGVGKTDYLVLTNRAPMPVAVNVMWDGKKLQGQYSGTVMASPQAKAAKIASRELLIDDISKLQLPANAVLLVKIPNSRIQVPQPTRIYYAGAGVNGIRVKCWSIKEAAKYIFTITDKSVNKTWQHTVTDARDVTLPVPAAGKALSITVQTENASGKSIASPAVYVSQQKPAAPSIFKLAPRSTEVSVFWHSVMHADQYELAVWRAGSNDTTFYNAANVFGYKVRDLQTGKSYALAVRSVNKFGKSNWTNVQRFLAEEGRPLPAHNISAIENEDGKVLLSWFKPKQFIEGTKYRLYRGSAPYRLTAFAEGLSDTSFTDNNPKAGEIFYSVKAYTSAGENHFFPNTATLIKAGNQITVAVKNVIRNEEGIKVTASFSNISTDGESNYYVLLSDVSYLNGEEQKFAGKTISANQFEVFIPAIAIRPNATYAVKAAVQTNGGTPVISLPPHTEIKPR